MSAETTNVEKQARQHSAPLIGIATVVGLTFLGFLIWLAWLFAAGTEPGETETVVREAPAAIVEPETAPLGAPGTIVEPAPEPVLPPADN